jgi:hypothetical protein
MLFFKRELAVLVLAIASAALANGCSGAASTCVPGDSKACACVNATEGAQVCKADGSGYATCQCETPTSSAGTSSGGAGSTSSAGTSSGGNGPCAPGTTKDCYDGPAGTENVGACHGGIADCLPDGSAFGACGNEVVPAQENCATTADEDCDGSTPPCPAGWAITLGDDEMSEGEVLTVAVAPNGDVVAGGELFGSMTVGGQTYTAPASGDGFVIKLSAEGVPIWTHLLTGLNTQEIDSVAIAPNGDVFAVGRAIGPGNVNFGAGAQTVGGTTDGFLWHISSDGMTTSGQLIGSAGSDSTSSVVVAANGDVILTGYYQGLISLGGMEPPDSKRFIARLDPTATTAAWIDTFDVIFIGLSLAPNGDILGWGTLGNEGSANLGLGNVDNVESYVVRFAANGTALNATPLHADPGNITSGFLNSAFTATTDGGFLFGAQFAGTLNIGIGAFPDMGGVFMGRFDATGMGQSGFAFGTNPSNIGLIGAAPISAGGAVISGYTRQAITLGATMLTPQNADAFIARLDGQGAVSAATLYGAPNATVEAVGVGLQPSGAIIAGGFYAGTGVNLGSGVLPANNNGRGFVARLTF